jgi:hypothetical protein
MNRTDQIHSKCASVIAVVSVACAIAVLYLPVVLG